MRKMIKRIKLFIFAVLLAAAAVFLLYGKTGKTGEEKGIIQNLLDLGVKYPKSMDYENAIAMLEGILKIDPQNPKGYADAVSAYLDSEKLEEMLGGVAWDDEQGQYDRLMELLDEVMKLLPEEFREEIRKQLEEKMR